MKIESVNIETTTGCNANCPFCSRTKLKSAVKLPIKHLDLEKFKQLDWKTILPNLNYLVLCGSFGDPILHPEFFKLIDIIQSMNKRMIIHTNGQPYNEDWWTKLARVLNDSDKVTFGLDGITKTTHEKYRGTDFETVKRNIKAFTEAGGHAGINFIVFKHNEYQIPDVNDFIKSLGLKYAKIKPSREYNDILQAPGLEIKKSTTCFITDHKEVSIDLDAKIHLCCQTYVRYFIKNIVGDKTPEWCKPLKRYDSFEQVQNSIYLNYIKEMDLCNPCGEVKKL